MSEPKLNSQIIKDTEQFSKTEKKKLKALLKDQPSSPVILSEVYKAKYPNKRILLT
jgi:hypothetical protein